MPSRQINDFTKRKQKKIELVARPVSFQGVSFRIDEVELQEDMRRMYNAAVDLWVDLMHKFEEAAALVDADKKIRKTMWGQFWSSHQVWRLTHFFLLAFL